MFPQILSTLAQPILREGAGNIFTDIISDVFGRSTRGRTEQGQGTAIERSTTSVPQETQASGVVEAVTAPVFSPSINIGQPAPQQRAMVQPQVAGFGGVLGPLTQLGLSLIHI